MAVRVRKLAKELKQTSGQVLGLLHHLGFEHYKSPDDMVPEPAIVKLQAAVKKGVRAAPVAVDERPRPAPAVTAAPNDFMAQVVPGIVRHGAPNAGGTPKAVSPPRAAAGPRTATDRDEIAALERALDEARSDAAVLRAELSNVRTELAQLAAVHREVLAQAQSAREAQQASLVAARAAEPRVADTVALADVLRERGLRGSDEAHRAIAELAAARRLDGWLDARLSRGDAERVRKSLAEIVLVGGARPEGVTGPVVTVAPDRADAPGHDELAAGLGRLGEALMLLGRRRIRVVGLPPRWHVAVRERLDRRVDVQFLATSAGAVDGDVDWVWLLGEVGAAPADARVTRTPPALREALPAAIAALRDA